MLVSVIIVNYNSGDCLERCVASLAERFAGVEYEAIIVDNASTDGSVTDAVRKTPGTTLIMGETNRGFAAASNAGAQIAAGRHLLFLNPDTRILSGGIGGLLARFEADERAGALGCRNVRPDGTLQPSAYGFPTLFLTVAWVFRLRELLALPGIKPALGLFLKDRFGQFNPNDRPMRVDWVTGAFLLVKRRAWILTGEFDQRFFLYCEEIDWCLRCKQKGFDVVFDPSFEIEHHVGYSAGREKGRALLEKFRSYLRYFEKHHAGWRVACLRLIFSAGARFWGFYYRLKGDREYVHTYDGVRRELSL